MGEISLEDAAQKLKEVRIYAPTPAAGTLTGRYQDKRLADKRTLCEVETSSRLHDGIDIGVPLNSPVTAIADGTIIAAEADENGYGNVIVIYHGAKAFSLYGHNNELIRTSGEVKEGEVIAKAGRTGLKPSQYIASNPNSGVHVHLAIFIFSKPAEKPGEKPPEQPKNWKELLQFEYNNYFDACNKKYAIDPTLYLWSIESTAPITPL